LESIVIAECNSKSKLLQEVKPDTKTLNYNLVTSSDK